MKTILNASYYLLGIIFNIFIFVLTIFLIVKITSMSFDFGKKFAVGISSEKDSQEITMTLREGATIGEVSTMLEKNGIVYSGIFYRLESMLKGSDSNFKAGTYTVNASMDSNEINRALRTIITSDIKITIKEGATINDIGEYLEHNEIVTKEDFINACNTIDFQYSFLEDVPMRENRLEGYLFPDTYFIAKGATSEQIINKMLTRFSNIYNEDCKFAAQKIGMSMDQIITIASIIEKEIRISDERGLASSVIYNRLSSDDRILQMCSTIQYALGKRKDRLVDEDLRVDSPYNTYLYPGLPIGPICNPGEACIKAALDPEITDYYYFVVKDENTGEHVFTKTYNEFLKAKEEFKQKY